jgi:tetratricopeptide (TPR) repeat protein
LAKLGKHFLHAGDRLNAAYYFGRLLELRGDAQDLVVVAEAAIERRDWNTVIERTTTLKNKFANTSTAKYHVPALERVIDSAGRISELDQRIDADESPVSLVLARGLLFRKLGFPEIGLLDGRRALKMAPGSLHARMAYAIIAAPRLREYGTIRKWKIAPSVFNNKIPPGEFLTGLARVESGLAEHPRDADLFVKRAKLLWKYKQYALARADIEAALAADPRNAAALLMKATILHDEKRTSAAVPFIERALAVRPKDRMVLLKGIEIFRAQGEYRKAIALCDTYLALGFEKHKDREIVRQRKMFYQCLQEPVPENP